MDQRLMMAATLTLLLNVLLNAPQTVSQIRPLSQNSMRWSVPSDVVPYNETVIPYTETLAPSSELNQGIVDL
uniref:Uncharacterized protein n=1 Tax=Cyanothece sp. (strain PCC 7425 / ATCC 29141) TaxID=395961 RepID=B8HUU9_CYAP4